MPKNPCSYLGCRNNKSKTNEIVRHHRFPVKDRLRTLQWLLNCGHPGLSVLSEIQLRSRYICSKHFLTSNYMSIERLRLRNDAIPISYVKKSKPQIELKDSNAKIELKDSNSQIKLKDSNSEIEFKELVLNKSTRTYEIHKNIFGPYSPPNLTDETSLTHDDINSSTIHVSDSTSNENSFLTSPKEEKYDDWIPEQKPIGLELNKNITKKRRKRKIQNLTNHRTRIQMKTQELQNLKIVKSLPLNSRSFLTMQLKGLKKRKIWDKAEKKLAMSIYYRFPSCYKYMRKIQISLPSERIVKHWIDSSKYSPRLNHKNVEGLKIKIEPD